MQRHAYTSRHRLERRLGDEQRVGVQHVDDVERVGTDDRRRRGRLRAESSRLASLTGRDDEDAARRLEGVEVADQVARLGRVEAELVDDADGAVAVLGGQRAVQRERASCAWAGAARSCADAGRRPRRRRRSAARCASPGGRGRCPSGGTAWRRRRGPRRASWCRGVPVRRPASCAVTAWCITASLISALRRASRAGRPCPAPCPSW